MAYYRGGKSNPFDDSNDEDCYRSTSNNRNPFDDSKSTIHSTNPFDDDGEEDNFEDVGKSPEFLRLKQEKDLLEKRMIDSTYRSVGLIAESQQIAIDTGEDLKVQREKLERTNRTLDKMQDDLNETDRNITGLKSIWGTMSNWFKKPIKRTTASEDSGSKEENNRSNNSNEIKENNERIQKSIRPIAQMNVQESVSVRYPSEPTSVDDIVDKNLDQMLAGLSMLKNQGLALGNEIDSQNVLLDDISSKVDKTDVRIGSQDNKIRKILK